jgi:predicted nucleic acid-binding protein
MALIVADSDVLIDYLNDINPGADRIEVELRRMNLATTAVSRFEVVAGVRDEKRRRRVEALLESTVTIPLDAVAADRAAGVRRALEKAGRKIGMADCLIAGIVLTVGGTLLTRNRREFERVAGLRLESP